MMAAFDETKPRIQLTAIKESSEIDEQRGFRFLFAGGVLAIEIHEDMRLILEMTQIHV